MRQFHETKVTLFLFSIRQELAEKLGDAERPRSPIDRDTPDEFLTEEERVSADFI